MEEGSLALRCECERAPARCERIRHQGGNQKSEFSSASCRRLSSSRSNAKSACWKAAAASRKKARLWNQAEGHTVSMRSKEKAHDYRYFPEPDLLPVHISAAWRNDTLKSLPELPEAKRLRFVQAFTITPYDAEVLTGSQALADYFEAVVKAGAPGKSAANWMQTELLRRLKDAGKEITDSPVSPASLAELLKLVESGKITGAIGKKVFPIMFESGRAAGEIVASEGLAQSSDTSAIEAMARDVIEKNPDNVAKFKGGNEGVFKFFVGQVIKASRGQANPQVVNDVLRKLLS
jgi:aspartyl-tRNA(Asn)/glutamyl-tRNA(Gln) amidotransferase subunit B